MKLPRISNKADSESARRAIFAVANRVLRIVIARHGRIIAEVNRGQEKVKTASKPGTAIAVTKNVITNVLNMLEMIQMDLNQSLETVQDIGAGDYAEPPPMWTAADEMPEHDCDCVMLFKGKIGLGVYVMGSFMTRSGETIAPSHYFIIPGVEDAV